MLDKKQKCPRCKSSRIDMRLNGQRFCKRCGQRWSSDGLMIPSFDRRKSLEENRKRSGEQLPLIVRT